jgi:hypothetical protein
MRRTLLVGAGGAALLLAMSLGLGQPIAEGSRLIVEKSLQRGRSSAMVAKVNVLAE